MATPHVTEFTPELTEIASGLDFPEGPIAMPDGSIVLVEMFGPETAWTIEGLLASVQARTSSGWAAAIGVVVLLYTSSSVMRMLRDSMNFIWQVPHKREATWWMWVEHYLVSLGGVLVAGLLLIVSLLGTTFLAAMKKYVPEGLPYSGTFLLSMEFLVTLVMVTVVCAMVFRFLPEARVLWRYVWLGAGFARRGRTSRPGSFGTAF